MKKKILTLLPLMCLMSCWITAQDDTLFISKLSGTQPLTLQMPVKQDTVNLKGDKFELKDLLATDVRLPQQKDFDNMLDTYGREFEIPQPESDYQIRFLSFDLTADRYGKATIEVTSPDMLELYVDGKMEAAKSTIEEKGKKPKELKKEVTLLPYQKERIILKLLSVKKDGANRSLAIAVYPSDKDSAMQLTASYTAKRRTDVHDDLEGTRPTSVSLSPYGDYALVDLRAVDAKGKVDTYTQLVELKTQATVNLGNTSPKWMPMTNRYYVTRKVADDLQLITIDPKTGTENILVNDLPKGSFDFSPDETFLLYSDKEENDKRKGDFKLLKSPDDRQPGYLDRTFIFKYDLATGVKQRLTFGKASTRINDVSADSRLLLYSTSTEIITERPFRATSMYILDLQTLQVDTLWQDQKFLSNALFSPDAKQLLVAASAEAFGGIGLNIKPGQTANFFDQQAFIYDRATKAFTAITKDFDPSVGDMEWDNVNGLIYLTVADKDCQNVYSYDPKSAKFALVNLPESVISKFTTATRANQAVYIGKSINQPARAYTCDLKTGKSTLISDPTQAMMQQLTLGKVTDWSFTSSDGTKIEGFYHLPPDFDPAKKYPLIVYFYGGTTPTTRTFEHPYSMHNFAALGYVVYTIQPSGAIGYGQEFSARHVNAWGKRTADDIIEGTKEFIKQHDFVDADRVGCVGASYGGFMTMYLQTQTDIFAAAIAHAGISALSSYWGEGYWGYSYSAAASADSYPWNNKELYVEQSPLFGADKIKTPILLTHGMDDTNVPVGESIQMYTALKILGAPVELLQVKGENHGIMKLERRIQWSQSMYAWFDKWLKDQPQWWDDLYGRD